MRFLRQILSVLPGPVAAWLNDLFGLFRDTAFSHPHWQRIADQSAIAIAAAVTMVIAFVYRNRTLDDLGRKAIFSLLCAIGFAAVALGIHVFLSYGHPRELVEIVKLAWMIDYILMLVGISTAISFAAIGVSR